MLALGTRSSRGRTRAAGWLWALGILAWTLLPIPQPAAGQDATDVVVEDGGVQLDFNDVELAVVIDTIARLTGRNFIYDDRVRGRVTIVSPTRIPLDEAYAVFESVLQVKGFTTVRAPGGAIKVIPIREAKESNVETVEGRRAIPKSDRFITRLIPLQYIDAEAITNTLKPLVSKDASMVSYPPTNTVILTDSATNISRIVKILRSIDVETYKEELTVLQVRHADASSLAEQLSEIFGAETAATQPVGRTRPRRTPTGQNQQAETAAKGRVRLLTDDRTNSLIVLASRQRLVEIREVVRRLDVPVTGGGRIHVYYLKHADAEELATTIQALISGQPSAPTAGVRGPGNAVQAQALRAAITELSEGVTVTADAPTNSLVIQASKEGYSTLSGVIAQLDIPRPQVLVEALIMEVDISNNRELGFNGIARIFNGNSSYTIGSLTDSRTRSALTQSAFGVERPPTPEEPENGNGGGSIVESLVADAVSGIADNALGGAVAGFSRNLLELSDTDGDGIGDTIVGGSLIQGIIRATSNQAGTNILSAPYILTSDNEEAEIKVGANIPIVTSRVQSAAGVENANNLATSQNIERQDIGITLRVTPQISEGDMLRLKIFQEITDINAALSAVTGDPQEVGVSLSNRTVENTVVVSDDETVVIGGLISDDYEDSVTKTPWLGDIPVLGWAFKSTGRSLTKTNLLIFLTPHIARTSADLEYQTIRKREEFRERSAEALDLSKKEKEEQDEAREKAEAAGIEFDETAGRNPVRTRMLGHAKKYPIERMLEIEQGITAEKEAIAASAEEPEPRYGVLAGTFTDEEKAAAVLGELIDAGYDGTLASSGRDGGVLYEVRIGPFTDLDEAESAVSVLRQGFDLRPSLTLETPDP